MTARGIAELLAAAYRAAGYDAVVGLGASYPLDAVVLVSGVVVASVEGASRVVDVRAESVGGQLVVPGYGPLPKRAA